MPKIRHGIYFVLSLALLSCSEKPQNNNAGTPQTAAATLSSDVVQLADHFLADSAQTRLVILLSPT